MCHALGDLDTAETMARRSLRSWEGNAHTEALSSLVLGSTLTSMGRFAEAVQALERAEELGRRQGSALFIGEALARRSRTHWCEGDVGAAVESASAARETAGALDEPLRGSGLALAEVLAWTIIAIKATRTTAPTSTNTSGKSFSVLRVLFPAEPALKSPIESLKALTMVGRVFIRVIIPPKVTAPAPMYLI